MTSRIDQADPRMGYPIILMSYPDINDLLPGHTRETLEKIKIDPASVGQPEGTKATTLRNHQIEIVGLMRTITSMVISSVFKERDLCQAQGAPTPSERNLSVIYAQPPVQDPATAKAIGSEIIAALDIIKGLHPQQAKAMPKVSLPTS